MTRRFLAGLLCGVLIGVLLCGTVAQGAGGTPTRRSTPVPTPWMTGHPSGYGGAVQLYTLGNPPPGTVCAYTPVGDPAKVLIYEPVYCLPTATPYPAGQPIPTVTPVG